MILPVGVENFKEAYRIGSEVYRMLKEIICERYNIIEVNVGEDGGFAPEIYNAEEAFELVELAIEKSGHRGKVVFGVDCAASEFYVKEEKKYNLLFKNKDKKQQLVTSDDLADIYNNWNKKFMIATMEDPLYAEDFDAWKEFTEKNGTDFQVIGDELLATNLLRTQIAIEKRLCNGVLLKINQIGTITEAITVYKYAKKNGWGVMISHRSGETEDHFISDLAVGLGTGQIKCGAPCRSERLAKYNQLVRIEEQLGGKGVYAGKNFKYPY
jgi:enolase